MAKTKKTSAVKSPVNEKEKLTAQLEALQKQEVESCMKEYSESTEKIMKKYGCKLIVRGEFVGSEIQSGLVIVKR